MKTGLIFVGFLFLINPDFITLDIIPDFIGYILIACGLSRLSLLEERIAAAKKWLLFLALTSVVKLFSSALVFTSTLQSDRLMFCFFFLVAEGGLSWLFCDNFFKGLHYLAIRRDGTLMLKSFDLVRGYVTGFFLAKAVINFLPQLPTIFFSEIDAGADYVQDYSAMRTNFFTTQRILLVIGGVLLVFFGIYTARIIKAYLKRCREDKTFYENLISSYVENVEKNAPLQTRLAIKGAFFWFFLAFVCMGDLYLDFINIFPKPLFAFFVFLGLRRLDAAYSEAKVPAFHKLLSLVSFAVLCVTYGIRLARLIATGDNAFPYLFPYEVLAWCSTVLNLIFSILPLWFVFAAISRCTRLYTAQDYRKKGLVVFAFAFVVSALSSCQYLFVGRSDLVVFLQWGLYAVLLYLHKSSMDDIFAEADYKLT
ncbi:MAG: hypothetical protein E7580_06775 [Ruminococcaceae bacterium]|nr:hypothetical protein [Oscillospiraceae bacterium]